MSNIVYDKIPAPQQKTLSIILEDAPPNEEITWEQVISLFKALKAVLEREGIAEVYFADPGDLLRISVQSIYQPESRSIGIFPRNRDTSYVNAPALSKIQLFLVTVEIELGISFTSLQNVDV